MLHSNGEAGTFYRKLKEQGVSVRVGIEATGHARWFERLLAELEYGQRKSLLFTQADDLFEKSLQVEQVVCS